jgi:glycosyltransferase involved in cell wall biosynthesis
MRILYILERPIQNDLPYRLIAKDGAISVTVLCIEKSRGIIQPKENLNQSVFLEDELYQFPYQFLSERISLKDYIRKSDIVVIYGHFHPQFRKAIMLAKVFRKKLILTSDATSSHGIAGSTGWKLKIKPFLFRILYNLVADALFVPSNASKGFFKSIGIHSHKIILTPYSVNEEFVLNRISHDGIAEIKKKFGIENSEVIFLFCGKLIDRKRPEDLVRAFYQIRNTTAKVILVGDGPLRENLELLVDNLKLKEQVIFTGLVSYNKLPIYYAISTVLVVPAEHEPYGLPVNEAMICGTPVIASTAVGAAQDLVENGVTGFVYPVADIDVLASKMKLFIDLPKLKNTLANNCQLKMKSWSSHTNVAAQIEFFKSKGWLS